MLRRPFLIAAVASIPLLGGLAIFLRLTATEPLAVAPFNALYADPAAVPTGPLKVLHLGHSLVGHDMPDMLAQLSQSGHSYNSQLG